MFVYYQCHNIEMSAEPLIALAIVPGCGVSKDLPKVHYHIFKNTFRLKNMKLLIEKTPACYAFLSTFGCGLTWFSDLASYNDTSYILFQVFA